MPKQDMLINYVPGEECRIALVEDNRLHELYTEREEDNLHVSNIYRGKVTNVEPSIQAAFIDFGIGRNGFLHISDLHPRYFPGEDQETTEKIGMKTPRRDRPPIQKCLRRGDKILVQVLKEGIGTKGPTLTSYLSIPGRFLVMLPNMERSGVSRKVEDDEARREIKKILQDLETPDGFGFIVRTAGIGRNKTELKRDLAYLNRLWKSIDQRMKKGSGPAELYCESDLTIRTIRDTLTSDIKRIIVDDPATCQRVREFMKIAMPRGATKIYHYTGDIPLFNAFDIESQIAEISAREVNLPSGGSIVIEQTEALVAIDVNSGKNRDNADAESTAYNTNKEAVDEIARQLRLRDLGGMIVNDFIDMYMSKHRRDIEKRFRDAMKNDRAKTKLLRINDFGLLAMTRQRMRPSLKKSFYNECPECHGTGYMKSPETVALEVIRHLAVVLANKKIHRLSVMLHPKVITALVNRKRRELVDLERRHGKSLEIIADANRPVDQFDLEGFDNTEIKLDLTRMPKPKPPTKSELELITAKWTPPAGIQIEESAYANLDEESLEDEQETVDNETEQAVEDSQDHTDENDNEAGQGKKKRRRRRRRGGRKHKSGENNDADNDNNQQAKTESDDAKSSGPQDNDSQNSEASQPSDTRETTSQKADASQTPAASDATTIESLSPKSEIIRTPTKIKRTLSPSATRSDDSSKPTVRKRVRRQPGRHPPTNNTTATEAEAPQPPVTSDATTELSSKPETVAGEPTASDSATTKKKTTKKSSRSKRITKKKSTKSKSTTAKTGESKSPDAADDSQDSSATEKPKKRTRKTTKKSSRKKTAKQPAETPQPARQSGGYSNEVLPS